MSNFQFALAAWCALLVHVAIGVIAWRRASELPLMPLLNGAVALCVIGYWATRWYSYVFKGIVWYWSDQWVPLYAVFALCVAVLALSGRLHTGWPNAVVFGINGVATLGAVLFATFFRMNRQF